MYDIRKALQGALLPVGVTVPLYYQDASDNADFPYIVYSFEPINTGDEAGDNFVLDVNGWDKTGPEGDTTALELLMQQIDGNGDLTDPTGLNQKVIETDQVILVVRRLNRQSIPDNDKTLSRRQYSYQVSAFEKVEV